MKFVNGLMLLVLCILCHVGWSESINSQNASWVFYGNVINENNDPYHYFFQMNRVHNKFYAIATLIDAQKNKILLYEESKTTIDDPDHMLWQVGHAFLQFNVINNSWIFGVKNPDSKGFNFKVDMLGQPDGKANKQQNLLNGVELLIGQTGRLNGHVNISGKGHDEFVTASHAWFRQLWLSKEQKSTHPLTAVLCDFHNGSGFYSVTLKGYDVVRGSIAGWRNLAGVALPISQFVLITEKKDGMWNIHVPYPKLNLALKDILNNNLNDCNKKYCVMLGQAQGSTPGFCAITRTTV